MGKWVAIIPLALGGLMAAAGAFFVRLGRLVQGFNRRIAAEGVDAQAEVTDLSSQKAARGDARTYYLTIAYTAPVAGGPPQTFTTKTEVSEADYDRLKLGDPIRIRYLPTAPTEMMLSGSVRDQTGPGFFRLGGLLLVLGVGLIVVSVAALLR